MIFLALIEVALQAKLVAKVRPSRACVFIVYCAKSFIVRKRGGERDQTTHAYGKLQRERNLPAFFPWPDEHYRWNHARRHHGQRSSWPKLRRSSKHSGRSRADGAWSAEAGAYHVILWRQGDFLDQISNYLKTLNHFKDIFENTSTN